MSIRRRTQKQIRNATPVQKYASLAGQGLNALVADTDTRWRGIVRRYMEDRGFDVTEACNMEQTEEALRKKRFSVASLDVRLGGDDKAPLAIDLLQRLSANGMYIPHLMFVSDTERQDLIVAAFNQFRELFFFAPKEQWVALQPLLNTSLKKAMADVGSALRKMRVFVSKSFHPQDESLNAYIENLFGNLMVDYESGEAWHGTDIPETIRHKIEECDVFVGIWVHYIRLDGSVDEFQTRPWILSETSWADGKGKRMILLVQAGIKELGVLGKDRQIIRFDDFSHASLIQLTPILLEALRRERVI